MARSINLELFSCSGGMAEGFKRAGITFDFVFDYDADACASYAANLHHHPIRMDVRDLVRMARGGWSPGEVNLLVADPPCTPWSRAGKRLGTEDDRDMLEETAELITLLRPRAYLIGNVPGLQDSTSWHVVQRVIGGLVKHGYCVRDYTSLDAADYGVPQHRIRPFWFGHLDGPCVRWPLPTHGDPSHPALPGLALEPWVTCRKALSHLPVAELGRPVRLKRPRPEETGRNWDNHPASSADEPSHTIKCNGGRDSDGASALIIENKRHAPAEMDAPAGTIGAKYRGQNEVLRVRTTNEGHPIRGGGDGHSAPEVILEAERLPDPRRVPETGETPSRAITTQAGSNHLLSGDWPWDRPSTTILKDPRIPPPGHHDTGSILTAPEARGQKPRRPDSTKGPQSARTADPDLPSPTIQAREDRIGRGATAEWPWDRPSTVVCGGIDKIAPANEHAGQFGPNAVVLSERAATILQGFPETWVFSGATKKARWAQLGMAMPPPLAEAVARSIKAAIEADRAKGVA